MLKAVFQNSAQNYLSNDTPLVKLTLSSYGHVSVTKILSDAATKWWNDLRFDFQVTSCHWHCQLPCSKVISQTDGQTRSSHSVARAHSLHPLSRPILEIPYKLWNGQTALNPQRRVANPLNHKLIVEKRKQHAQRQRPNQYRHLNVRRQIRPTPKVQGVEI